MYMKMKKIFNILVSLTLFAALTGCNFLERPSKTTMNDENYWTSEANIRLFVNNAYPTYFAGYNSNWTNNWAAGAWHGEFCDDVLKTGAQTNTEQSIPEDNWYRAETNNWQWNYGGAGWNFGWIRKWNLLMERLDMMKEKGNIEEEPYNHWYGVARFFRAYEYYRLVVSFGDVPWYDKVVGSEDMAMQFKQRDSRVTVMNNVKADFEFALANVRENDGENYVNKDVVAAIASRAMLFEGTWEKYHNVSGGTPDVFLNSAVAFGDHVINKGKYTFDADFRLLFGQKKKSSNEIIMFREYSDEHKVRHAQASYANLSENQTYQANASYIKSFICVDGKTYGESTVANAESFDIADLVKTRDSRFEATFWDEPTNAVAAASPLYCVKFIDRIGPTYKYCEKDAEGFGKGSYPPQYGSNTNNNGYPVIRYAEVVLNWIEAKAELGTATQTDIDKSINAIRNRPLAPEAIAKGVQKTAPLMLSALPNDPARTSSIEANTTGGIVEPLIWEIRRERRMEFFLEQYRVVDIRRWGKLELMQGATNPDILLGSWVDMKVGPTTKIGDNWLYNKDGSANNVGKITVINAAGQEVKWDGTNADALVGWKVPTNVVDRQPVTYRNYLSPICTDIVDEYKQKSEVMPDVVQPIVQNPGW